MSDAKVRGIVHVIEDTKTYGKKGFRKRLVVIEQDNGRFVNYVPVEFTHEGCDKVDELKVGDDVEITYRLSGRKWQRDERSEVKYFLNAEATDFQVVGGKSSAPASNAPLPDDESEAWTESDDEIPF